MAVAPGAYAARSDSGPPGVHLVVSATSVPVTGGTVAFRAEAAGAVTCWFSVRGAAGYVPRPRDCARGVDVGSLRVGAIAQSAARRIVITAFARRGRNVARSTAVVTQSAASPVAVTGLGKVGGVVASGGYEVPSVARPAPPAAQLVAYPVRLTRSGGRVVERLASFRGLACWFAVAGDLGDHTTPVPCSNGFTDGTLVLPPNRGKFARVVKIIGYVKNVDKTVRSISSVVQPGRVAELPGKAGPGLRPGAPVVDLASAATSIGPSGGSLPLHVAAIGATTCWLVVPGDPAASTHRPCTDGFASLDALLGRNTSGLSRSLTIVAFASNGSVVTRQAIVVTQASTGTGRVGVTGIGPTVVPSTPRRSVLPAVTPTVIPQVTPEVPSNAPPPSYTPPSYTPPSYTPPSYTPPSYTPPSYTPPSYTPPSTPPSVAALSITTTSLPNGTVSSAYSTTLAASGGVSPYVWSLGSGSSLPSGLSLSSGGAISGTPSAAGTTSIVVTVTDHAGTSVSATLSLDVVAGSALSILTTELPDGTPYSGQPGSPYSADLVASGGSGSYTWSLASGSALPSGLSLSSSGVISGPTVGYGPHTFTVVVADAANPSSTASQALVIYGTYQQASVNWSGYAVGPGPFTGASGSFTVPNIAATTVANGTDVSIWVGLDGDGNHLLIQAGVQLQDYPGEGVQIFPWWEILPATETPITTMGTVSAGDTVNVAISQLSEATTSTAGSWSITVTDETTGQSFSTTQAYTGGYTGSAYGEGASAEWIVERPKYSYGYSTLGTYSPTVNFTNLDYTGSPATWWQDLALTYDTATNGLCSGSSCVTVSSPSAIDAKGFDVAYGANPPSEPS